MPPIIALIMLLYGSVGPSITPYWSVKACGVSEIVARSGEAAFSCPDRTLYLPAGTSVETLAHEYAHAYDCLDDGALNGSPGHPYPGLALARTIESPTAQGVRWSGSRAPSCARAPSDDGQVRRLRQDRRVDVVHQREAVLRAVR